MTTRKQDIGANLEELYKGGKTELPPIATSFRKAGSTLSGASASSAFAHHAELGPGSNGPMSGYDELRQHEVAKGDAGDGQVHLAPDGTTYVGVDWQFLPGHGLPAAARALMDDPDQTVRLTLVADGERYPLGDTASAAGDVFVPVAGDGELVSVEVEFDGEVPSVDARTGHRMPGAFAPLYDLGDGVQVTCAGLRAERGTTESTCSALVLDLPYLPGRGWSETSWTVVQLTTRTTSYRRAGSDYQVGEVTDESTIDGAAPASSTPMAHQAGELTSWLAAEGHAGYVEVRREADATLISGTGPESAAFALLGRITLPGG